MSDTTGIAIPDTVEVRTITVPVADLDALGTVTVTVLWVCPVCGGPRGEPELGVQYGTDASSIVDTWQNPCGHVDLYAAVRKEAAA